MFRLLHTKYKTWNIALESLVETIPVLVIGLIINAVLLMALAIILHVSNEFVDEQIIRNTARIIGFGIAAAMAIRAAMILRQLGRKAVLGGGIGFMVCVLIFLPIFIYRFDIDLLVQFIKNPLEMTLGFVIFGFFLGVPQLLGGIIATLLPPKHA